MLTRKIGMLMGDCSLQIGIGLRSGCKLRH